MPHNPNVLLVNENKDFQVQYEDFFAMNGFNVLTAQKPSRALDLIKKNNVEIVLIGFKKSPASKSPLTKLLDSIKEFDQRIEVLLIAPHFPEEFTVKAVQWGAADCISRSG